MKIFLAASVVFANLVNLFSQLLLPRIFSPGDYSYVTTYIGFSQVLSMVFFEWLRHYVIRFCFSDEKYKKSRIVVFYFYTTFAASLIIFSFLFCIFDKVHFGAIIFFAVTQGISDGVLAKFRATLENKKFVIFSILRSIFYMMVLVACEKMNISGPDNFLYILGLANLAPILIFIGCNFPVKKINLMEIFFLRKEILLIIKFGLPIVLSSAIVNSIIPISKNVVLNNGNPEEFATAFFLLDVVSKFFIVVCVIYNTIYQQNYINYFERTKSFFAIKSFFKNLLMIIGFIFIVMYFWGGKVIIKILPEMYINKKFYLHYNLALIFAIIFCVKTFIMDGFFIFLGNSGKSLFSSGISLLSIVFVYFFVIFLKMGATGFYFGLILGWLVAIFASIFIIRFYVANKA